MASQLDTFKTKEPRPIWLAWIWCAAPVLILAAGLAWLALRPPPSAPNVRRFDVSQRGREFRPGLLEIARGDVVHIVNDDGDISHHAYVATPGFSFDSGDQEPGGDVAIAFIVNGTFNVLCGIHPKMRLTVHVQ